MIVHGMVHGMVQVHDSTWYGADAWYRCMIVHGMVQLQVLDTGTGTGKLQVIDSSTGTWYRLQVHGTGTGIVYKYMAQVQVSFTSTW